MKHLLPREITHSGLGETIQVWGSIEIDDDGLEATIHSKVDGHHKETDYFTGQTFKELETDMAASNYPFEVLMEKVRSLRYWPRLKKRIERDEADQDFQAAGDKVLGRVLAQNNDGTVKIGNRKFWSSNFARKTVLLKGGKEINTTLGSGPIENVTFNESKNVFTGTLLSKDNDYKFEICAKSGDIILQEKIQK